MGRRPGRKDRDNGKQKEKLSKWFPWNLGEWRSRAREGVRVMLCGWEVRVDTSGFGFSLILPLGKLWANHAAALDLALFFLP